MPQDNVEAIRKGIEAYSRGDFQETLDGFHPDVVWEVGADVVPDARTYVGHEGVREFWETWADVFPVLRLDVEECWAVDERRVVAVTRAHGTGSGSGISVRSARFSQIFDFRGDKVSRVRLHASKRAALAELD
jgi:ketosteroid isomerase-like protein